MLRVGITGGIGSGKSTACNMFRNLGIPIFTADEVGKKILNEDKAVKKQVIHLFGEDMYTSEGKIDRPRMAQLVFNDPNELEKLNEIVHPKINETFEEWVEENSKAPYVLKEAAILLETGNYHTLDKVINVFASKAQRIERIKKRDQVSEADVLKRMRFQFSDAERNKMADYIIMNEDGNEEDLLPQIMELHEILLNETKQWSMSIR